MRETAPLLLVLVGLACGGGPTDTPGPAQAPSTTETPATTATTTTTSTTTTPELSKVRNPNPDRVDVYDAGHAWVATFTVGSRTVTVKGPVRVFAEASTPATVATAIWVRLLPAPFDGTVDDAWLQAARADTSPDVLAVAGQYLADQPPMLDANGLQIAGDANYGPLLADGTRGEGSDFNDYLGISWTDPDGTVDAPEAAELLSLDCSGLVRMVYGYRFGLPVSRAPLADRSTLPRRSFELMDSAPGTLVRDLSTIRPGDLVFFDASTDDGTRIDHVGIYLGEDSAGARRFVSSRKSANGPTLGDYHGASVLDGEGLYARTFRGARRL